jgi:hypothetical protein
MNPRIILSFLLNLFLYQFVMSQSETYIIQTAPFSSERYDEFCPVFYRNGIVFISNRKSGLADYSSSHGAATVNINFIDTTDIVTWRKAGIFSKSLKTPLNDGPVTFNSTGDTIYYSRNLQVDGKISDLSSPRNKLGIFTAVLEGAKWTKIRELRFNNEFYNISTPWLAPDGRRLYFASDKPDGFGGSDLYYCDWRGDHWADPVNLGPVINTSGNEAYPFVNPAGELLFASDGHPGLGGKDIFFSRPNGKGWLPPVRIDPPINSEYDDFGIITDSLFSEGYFSSNRNGSVDIFRFKTMFPQIFYTDIQKENQYCFRFTDEGSVEADTLNLRYLWDFGDGKKAFGKVVHHCFPGSGDYKVRLDIVDRATGNLFFTKLIYTVELRDFEQAYIKSPDVAVSGEDIQFDALSSYLPGYEILSYSWEFGEGTRLQGQSVKHSFKENGEYNVNLGVTLKSETTGIIHKTGVSKKIVILGTAQDKASWLSKKAAVKHTIPDIRDFENALIKTDYSAEEQIRQTAIFRIELISSKSRLNLTNDVFRNLSVAYSVKEEFDPVTKIYSYYVDELMNLMEAYPAYRELKGLGFRDVIVKLNVIKDPIEKDLYNIKKNYGLLSDDYFDTYGRLRASAYLLLDQIVILMNRYPGILLEVSVFTDNLGVAANNLQLSQTRAQLMVNYLVNRGINAKRLRAIGYGGARPVASNILEKDRRLNRRVDFRIINSP